MDRLLRFLVDIICHLQQNRPKTDALDIAADTSVGSQLHEFPSTSTFSTSKTDLEHSFTMRWSPNRLCYGMAVHHDGHGVLPICGLWMEKTARAENCKPNSLHRPTTTPPLISSPASRIPSTETLLLDY